MEDVSINPVNLITIHLHTAVTIKEIHNKQDSDPWQVEKPQTFFFYAMLVFFSIMPKITFKSLSNSLMFARKTNFLILDLRA